MYVPAEIMAFKPIGSPFQSPSRSGIHAMWYNDLQNQSNIFSFHFEIFDSLIQTDCIQNQKRIVQTKLFLFARFKFLRCRFH